MQTKIRTSCLRRSQDIRRLISLWRELHEASPAREVCDTELRIITEDIPPLRPTASHELFHRIMDELTLIKHEELDSGTAQLHKMRHVVDLFYIIRFTPVMRMHSIDLLLAYLRPWYVGGQNDNILYAEGADQDLSQIEEIGKDIWQYLPIMPMMTDAGWRAFIGELERVEQRLQKVRRIPAPPLHENILGEMRLLIKPQATFAKAQRHVQS
ncbi:MAG: hypothetical protein AAB490_05130 [Patescibacteria group bacterium]